jgi:serine protease Do
MSPQGKRLMAGIRSHQLLFSFLILVTLTLGILIGTVISKGVKGNESSDATPVQVPAPQQLSSVFSKVAKQIEPAVVNISTESTVKPRSRRRGNNPDDNGDNDMQDFFDRFFGGQGGPFGSPFGNPEGMRTRSLGSGVILDAKGYIVTNAHVVEDADRIRVRFLSDAPGAQPHNAKVIGVDKETDLAVIKVDSDKELPYAKLGNSDAMNVGDWVLAVGSPFGLEETVTAGIVSSKGRNIDPTRQFQSFLQTDAAINPGNSGGPLVNMSGEVVGINTAIFTESGTYAGVGFAMPSNTVANIYNQLIGPEHRVVRGSIGVTFNAQPNPAIARVYGVEQGVIVASVKPGGPADAAGLKIGDAIVAVNGEPIKSGDELVNKIVELKPGAKATLTFIRNGKKQDATVTIASREKLYGETEEQTSSNEGPTESKMGISVTDVSGDLARQLDITPGRGVIVTDVKPGSFAEDIGLQRGNVILEVNRKPVNSEQDFHKLTSELKSGEDVVFLVRQGRGSTASTIFLGGTLP